MTRLRPPAALAALLLAALLLVPGAAPAAVGDPAYRLPDRTLEERAERIGRELRCLICQNQSIEDSDAEIARDLRRLVREQIASGRSDSEVMRFVHDRYGDFVLLRPRITAATALLWATPAIAVGGGLWLILAMRRRTRLAAPEGALAAVPELTEAERRRLRDLEGGSGTRA